MFRFDIQQKVPNSLARAGIIHTAHGAIETPAFIVVGTKATVKAMTPDMVASVGAQAVLANTYHLYLQPGDEIVARAGGLSQFMHWPGPTFTDSGGFQVFSLGEAFGKKVSKVASPDLVESADPSTPSTGIEQASLKKLCTIDEEGVTFKSHLDGSSHRLTPEKSMQIQWNLGADIIFAFDECTSPHASHDYQKEALQRTHRWAERCIVEHEKLDPNNVQALFGVVQGGRFEDLRKESARQLSSMNFDGFGIGGSFSKDDISTAVRWVNETLPPEKPRHLLGIGEPLDMLLAIEQGVDTFDCVIPTRLARHGHVYTRKGIINLKNSQYKTDFSPIDPETPSYTSLNYTRAYMSHLYRADEMLAGILGSLHNTYFLIHFVKEIRQAILDGKFDEFKAEFLKTKNLWEK